MNTPATKFSDPAVTLDGSTRAVAPFVALDTLWFNTGSLCNLTCANCYMESSPTNDALVYLTREEIAAYVTEAVGMTGAPTTIGFTGGEPFLNPDMVPILADTLATGVRVLVLTNAMKPLRRREAELLELRKTYGDRLVFRISLDHHTPAGHDRERGDGGFEETVSTMSWLSSEGFRLHCAGRSFSDENPDKARDAYARLFEERGVVLSDDPDSLVIFPEMDDGDLSPPEITTSCWDILSKEPTSVMCANSRMVVKRRGDSSPTVARCTLLPYDDFFNSGPSLRDSFVPTPLKHVYCAQFCVLGGASCG